MKKYLYVSILLAVMVSCARVSNGERVSIFSKKPVRYEWGLPIDSFRVDTGIVRQGETLGGMLNRLGANRQQIAGIIALSRSEFDYRQIRPGKMYYALYQPDSLGVEQLRYYVYVADIRQTDVIDLSLPIHVEKQIKEVEVRERVAQAVIESSLWNAMVSNDLPPEIALELSDIYAWTIDFFGLQKGDSIRVYYDEQYVDDTRIGIGRIHASHFYHNKHWQQAYWYENEGVHNYYDEKGQSLRKAFLKAPLNYKRISSKFTYARKHPIYKTVRPHTGVDYAAPAGTPVVTIGDGVVTMRQYKGGGGNTIKIKHNSTYSTAYLHLKGYAKGLTVGKHVRQGEVIGYVGSTGSSTGPHLDFRVWKNGSPIDPLKMVSPPAEPVPTKYKEDFMQRVVGYQEKLSVLH